MLPFVIYLLCTDAQPVYSPTYTPAPHLFTLSAPVAIGRVSRPHRTTRPATLPACQINNVLQIIRGSSEGVLWKDEVMTTILPFTLDGEKGGEVAVSVEVWQQWVAPNSFAILIDMVKLREDGKCGVPLATVSTDLARGRLWIECEMLLKDDEREGSEYGVDGFLVSDGVRDGRTREGGIIGLD
ncbi:hypothetical protein Scep_026067 [Stephania cephalantha]|uniref:Uncharacterized protein n=1 Tax=Stephania cephalantha TaxID=152367 RepID=A0AAP0ERN1_9MAGN